MGLSLMQKNGPQKSGVSRGRLFLMGVLGVSLMLNAVTVGAIWRFQKLRVDMVGNGRTVPAYPSEVRQALRRQILLKESVLHPALRETVQARLAVIETAAQEPFDSAATEAAMREFRVELDQLLDLAQGVVLDVLEDRAAQE